MDNLSKQDRFINALAVQISLAKEPNKLLSSIRKRIIESSSNSKSRK